MDEITKCAVKPTASNLNIQAAEQQSISKYTRILIITTDKYPQTFTQVCAQEHTASAQDTAGAECFAFLSHLKYPTLAIVTPLQALRRTMLGKIHPTLSLQLADGIFTWHLVQMTA